MRILDRRIILIVLFATLLPACSSTPQSQTQPTLDLETQLAQIEYIAATQAVSEWTRNSLAQFQLDTGWTDFQLEYISSIESNIMVEGQDFQLFIQAGPPPEGWFATPLGEDAIAVIVHPDNPIRDLDPNALGDVFSGRVQTWEELDGRGGYIQPVIPLEGDELREIFERTYLPGAYHLGSRLAPTPQAMLTIVAGNPDAIGFIPLHVLDSTVKALSIQGIRASEKSISDGSYPLAFTIVATAEEEPHGTIRSWLEWVQIGLD
jgi:DNA-binding transcriptional LysR family regulator